MNPTFAPLLSSFILTAVFALMWRTYRERWLGLWAVAASLFLARYGFALLAGEYRYLAGSHVLPLLAVGRGYFLLAGAYALSGRDVPRPLVALFVLDLALLLAEFATADVLFFGNVVGVTHYGLFGGATILSGAKVFEQRRQLGAEARMVALALACIGVVNVSFPWTSRMTSPVVPQAFFLFAHASQLAVGFGALLIFHRRASAERDAAMRRMEKALAKALSGYLPICAHCKSIRSEAGGWERIETYVSSRTEAAFTHGICPPCATEHFGIEVGPLGEVRSPEATAA